MDIPKLDIQKANLYKFVPCPTPLADGDSHSFIFLYAAKIEKLAMRLHFTFVSFWWIFHCENSRIYSGARLAAED